MEERPGGGPWDGQSSNKNTEWIPHTPGCARALTYMHVYRRNCPLLLLRTITFSLHSRTHERPYSCMFDTLVSSFP